MEIKIPYAPLPKQWAVHNATEPYVAYVGGVGSGKTFCGSQEMLRRAVSEPRYILIGAPTYPLLRDTTRKEFLDLCPEQLILKLNKTDNELQLRANGGITTVVFRTLENPMSLKNYNLSDFWMDEGSEAPEDSFLMLQSRLRRKGVSSYRGLITTNPEGRNWVWKRFVDTPPRNPALQQQYRFVHAPTKENERNLPSGYLERLTASYPPFWVKRYLDADFNVFEGQIYTNYSEYVHVIEPFDIPPGWDRYLGVDHGMRNPTAAEWGAVDHDGNLFIYDEYYSPGLVSEHAQAILAKCGSGIDDIQKVLDPNSINLKDPIKGKSIQEEYADHGVHFMPGNDKVIAGINRVSELLKIDPARAHPRTGQPGAPRIFIFKNCRHLVEQLPLYKWEKVSFAQADVKDPHERPVKKDDHALDALRYLVMLRFGSTEELPVVVPGSFNSWGARIDEQVESQDYLGNEEL